MLYVPTTGALPSKGPICSRLVDLFENRISLIADRRMVCTVGGIRYSPLTESEKAATPLFDEIEQAITV